MDDVSGHSAERAAARGGRRGGPGLAGLGSLPVRTRLGHGAGGLQRSRHRLGLLPARPRAVAGRTGGTTTGWPASATTGRRSASRSRCGTARTRSSRSASSGSAAPRATTARTPRSTGGTSTPPPPTPGCGGATTTRRAGFPYGDLVRANARAGPRASRSSNWSTPASSTRTGTGRVSVDYAKASPTDMCIQVTLENRGPQTATLHVLPTLWFRNTWAWGLPGWDDVPQIHGYDKGTLVAKHRILGRLVLAGEAEPEALCCDNESNATRLWGLDEPFPVPEGRHQRLRGRRQADGEPGPGRHQGCAALRGRSSGRRHQADPAPAGTRRRPGRRMVPGVGREESPETRPRRGLRRRDARPQAGGGRVLRRGHAGGCQRGRGDGAPPGGGRSDVGQAVLPLRRGPMAQRRPGGQGALADPPAQPPLVAHVQLRHHLDARSVGVPVVRGLGSRLPVRGHRPGRPRLRQGATPAAVAGVVHAPQWTVARVRVGVRRREPTGARLGRVAGVRIGRCPRLTTSWPGCCTSC